MTFYFQHKNTHGLVFTLQHSHCWVKSELIEVFYG